MPLLSFRKPNQTSSVESWLGCSVTDTAGNPLGVITELLLEPDTQRPLFAYIRLSKSSPKLRVCLPWSAISSRSDNTLVVDASMATLRGVSKPEATTQQLMSAVKNG